MTALLDSDNISFSVVLTTIKHLCLVCPYEITPESDPKHMVIHLVSNEHLHNACFEKLGWSINYFTFHYKVANIEELGVN